MSKANKVEGEKTGRRILRAPAVEERTQRSRVQCWRDIKANKFPLPVQLGPNSVGWFEDEIDDWLASRPRQMCPPPASVEKSQRAKGESKPEPSLRPVRLAASKAGAGGRVKKKARRRPKRKLQPARPAAE